MIYVIVGTIGALIFCFKELIKLEYKRQQEREAEKQSLERAKLFTPVVMSCETYSQLNKCIDFLKSPGVDYSARKYLYEIIGYKIKLMEIGLK